MWICGHCGQDSEELSANCEICDEPRGTVDIRPRPGFFEIDGKRHFYGKRSNLKSDETLSVIGDFG